jgi:hypothetical protein
MNDQFDELTRSLAQSVTRRGALKKFGVGLAGMALACLGLVDNAKAEKGGGCKGHGSRCHDHSECCSGLCQQTRWGKPGGICY